MSDESYNGDDGDWNGILDESLRSFQWFVPLTHSSISLSIKMTKQNKAKKKVTCFGGFAYIGNHMEFTFYMVSTQEIILTMIKMKKWSLSEMSLWFCWEESHNISNTSDLEFEMGRIWAQCGILSFLDPKMESWSKCWSERSIALRSEYKYSEHRMNLIPRQSE